MVSCLIDGKTINGRPIHAQCSYPSRPLAKIITVYEPDPALWIKYNEVRREKMKCDLCGGAVVDREVSLCYRV